MEKLSKQCAFRRNNSSNEKRAGASLISFFGAIYQSRGNSTYTDFNAREWIIQRACFQVEEKHSIVLLKYSEFCVDWNRLLNIAAK